MGAEESYKIEKLMTEMIGHLREVGRIRDELGKNGIEFAGTDSDSHRTRYGSTNRENSIVQIHVYKGIDKIFDALCIEGKDVPFGDPRFPTERYAIYDGVADIYELIGGAKSD